MVLINKKNSHSQSENGKTRGSKYPSQTDSEVTKTHKISEIPCSMPKILPDDEIAEGIYSLISKQRELFNVVNKWAKDYVKYDGHNIKSVYMFLSGRGGKGKSYIVKVICNVISKHCLNIVKTLKNLEFFYLDLKECQQKTYVEAPFILVLELNLE